MAARGLAEAARTRRRGARLRRRTRVAPARPHSTRRKRRLVGAARRWGPAASRGSSREREPRSADARRCGSSTSPSPESCPAAPQCRLGSLARRLEKHSPPSGFARPRYSALHARPAGHCPGIISILGHNAFERQFWLQCAGFQSSCERAAGYVPCTANECSRCQLRHAWQRVLRDRARRTLAPRSADRRPRRMCIARDLGRMSLVVPRPVSTVRACSLVRGDSRAASVQSVRVRPELHLVESVPPRRG